MISYPGQMFGLYDPPELEKEQCKDGIPCVFGICSECTQGVSQEELNKAKANYNYGERKQVKWPEITVTLNY